MGEILSKVPGLGLIVIFTLLAGFIALVLGFAKGTSDDAQAELNRTNERILNARVPSGFIDEVSGSYRGTAIGDHEAKVRRLLGKPIDGDSGRIFQPKIAHGSTWNGSNPVNCPKKLSGTEWKLMVYREVVFDITDDRVCAFEVAGGGWKTSGDTTAGDPIEDLQARFGPGECTKSGPPENSDYEQWGCEYVTWSGVKLYFTGDPVTTVGVGSRRLHAAAD